MITIHWIILAILFSTGFYVGLICAAALRANDWQDDDDQDEQYEPLKKENDDELSN